MGRRAAVLPTNIALLQNLIRRDPGSYKEEFRLQHQHYASLREIFMQNPRAAQNADEFSELVGFVTQMCNCYPEDTKEFPLEVCALLSEHYDNLPASVADKLVQCLVMMRNKDHLDIEQFVQTLFPVLVATESKQLRTKSYGALIQAIKTANEPSRSPRANKMIQALLFNLLDDAEANGLWATKITRELWRRGVWDDSRSIEIMTTAALSSDPKVAAAAVRFFLGADREREEALAAGEESDSDLDVGALKHRLTINKKSTKRTKQIEAAMRSQKRKQTGPGKDSTHLNFSAIHLLRDPQGFAEKLFQVQLAGSGGKGAARLHLEQKIDVVNLVSRLVGTHKLTVLGLYSFLLRYLTPKQKDVTQFMAATAQASHDLVPPDVLQPVVRKIADEFVSDGVASEVAAAGLNTIREILARAPLSIEEPLLHDLIEYRKSKAKNVVMAARGLIQLFRDIDPAMLPAKERGKTAAMAVRSGDASRPKFGEVRAGTIEGLDLLDKYRQARAVEAGSDEEVFDADDGWQVASADESDSDESDNGWMTVESDKEYAFSGSDDENDGENSEKPEKPTEKTIEELQQLAASEILTPADFARLDQLKMEQGVRQAMGQSNEEIVEAMNLVGSGKHKENKEERLARVQEGREDREKFGSHKRHHAEKEHSTTNKQKARRKNFMMMIHKRDVQGKARRSLRDKQRVLRAHITRQKKKK